MTRADLYAAIDAARSESSRLWHASLVATVREYEARLRLAQLADDPRDIGFHAGLVWRYRETAAAAAERLETP